MNKNFERVKAMAPRNARSVEQVYCPKTGEIRYAFFFERKVDPDTCGVDRAYTNFCLVDREVSLMPDVQLKGEIKVWAKNCEDELSTFAITGEWTKYEVAREANK